MTINELETKVLGLKSSSSDIKFIEVFEDIAEKALEAPNTEIVKLRNILHSYRNKLSQVDFISLDSVRGLAKILAEQIMVQTLADRISAINARNQALIALTGKLQDEIDKANEDKDLLEEIKKVVDLATAGINEIKTLINELEDTEGGLKADLLAFLTALANANKLFEQENA